MSEPTIDELVKGHAEATFRLESLRRCLKNSDAIIAGLREELDAALDVVVSLGGEVRLPEIEAAAELRRDAERYRWIRTSGATINRTMRPGEKRESVEVDAGTWTRRATLDAAIDAAMAGTQGEPA
jgi:hypothetical protein